MTRTAFLAALEQLLAPLPETERKDALSYYEDYLDAAGPEKEAQAIAELGTPEEVAHKILEEQAPAGSSAAPASPAHKPRFTWRMVLGGGLAVLVLACFFFQHSKATPVQPVEPCVSGSRQPSSVRGREQPSSATSLSRPIPYPLPIPADDLGNSTLLRWPPGKAAYRAGVGARLRLPWSLSPTQPLTSDVYATFQFDNFRPQYPSPCAPLMNMGTPPWSFPTDCQITGRCPPDAPDSALLTVTLPADALHPVDLRSGGGGRRPWHDLLAG